ncbi:hypothetical protein BCR34DRAFT_587956 [Clohesyomyces aquaticus]|uniref:Uncharacterized protein n=1 Tax=Clohesyomyces aquaticus TaxID=1231657 RepID=A0A1Y1ZM01_9PLEO|nr:hypothetical protein BCR34DRAFT_587956 [Clohesyomyces aquaticus]
MLYHSMNVLWPRRSSLLFLNCGDTIIRGVYTNMVSFGTIIAGWYCVSPMPWIGHERWQLGFFITAQTAPIESMASIGLFDKSQAIATGIAVSACNLPPSPLSFGMHCADAAKDGAEYGVPGQFPGAVEGNDGEYGGGVCEGAEDESADGAGGGDALCEYA